MQTSLRKMGNSTGVILPRAILGEAGLSTGAVMNVSVEGERVVLSPVRSERREGWAEDAAEVAAVHDTEAEEWLAVPNEADVDLSW
jgi:antitoxin MazE